MKVVFSDRLRRCTPPAIRLWIAAGWLRISPGCGRGFLGRPEQKPTSGLRKPITAPCGSLLSWLLAQAPLQGHILAFPRCTRWRSRAATWVSLMTPQRNAAEV